MDTGSNAGNLRQAWINNKPLARTITSNHYAYDMYIRFGDGSLQSDGTVSPMGSYQSTSTSNPNITYTDLNNAAGINNSFYAATGNNSYYNSATVTDQAITGTYNSGLNANEATAATLSRTFTLQYDPITEITDILWQHNLCTDKYIPAVEVWVGTFDDWIDNNYSPAKKVLAI